MLSASSHALRTVMLAGIPAASNIGVAAGYGDWSEAAGAAMQLGINLLAIVAAGVLTLFVQRRYYVVQRRKHLMDPSRTAAGLPIGRSMRGTKQVRGRRERQEREIRR